MSDTSTGRDPGAARYEIRLKGHLDSRWTAWFDGLSLTKDSDGTTVVSGLMADQAALNLVVHRGGQTDYPLVLGVVMYRLSIELSRRKDELVLEKRRADEANLTKTRVLAELASRDELTGLFNRRHMSELLAQQRMACQRSGEGFAVALVDLDHFKRINDIHGHAAGDSVLRAFAEQAEAAMRGTDNVGRWGGEEFLIIYPRSTAHEAAQGATRLCERVAAAVVMTPGGQPVTFTVSIGLTEHVPPESVEAMVERADRAMYQAKSQGRNRVVTQPDSTATGQYDGP